MVPSAISRIYTSEVLGMLTSVQRPPPPREDHGGEVVRLRHEVFSGETLASHALQARRAAWSKGMP